MGGYTNQQKHKAESNRELKNKLNEIQSALDASTMVAITDTAGVILEANDKFCKISKYTREELLGNTHRILKSGQHSSAFFRTMWQTIQAGRIWTGEICNRAKDGSYYWTRATIVPLMNEEKEPERYIAIRHDITDRVQAELQLQKIQEDNFRVVIKNLHNGVFKMKQEKNDNFVFTMSEGMIAEKSRLTTETIYGKTIYDIFEKELATYLDNAFRTAIATNSNKFDLTIQDRHYMVNIGIITDAEEYSELAGSIVDITEQTRQAKQIHKMVYFDELTGLPNRRSFVKAVNDRILRNKNTGNEFAVLFIFFDRFQSINETLGHKVGDEMVLEVARRLADLVGEKDEVVRFSGNEFAVIFECEMDQAINRKVLIDKCAVLIEKLGKGYIVRNMEMYSTPSIGISLYPDHGDKADTLIHHADAALGIAKERGGNSFVLFDENIKTLMTRRVLIEGELRKESSREQLQLMYQPKVDGYTRKLSSVEVLLRWYHPTLGRLSPTEFIPIAEKSGLIISLGHWVLAESLRQLKQWHDRGHRIAMSINISVHQFTQSDFANQVEQVIQDSGVDPSFVELEVTESVAENPQLTRATMQKLKEIGVFLSMDDFGTGYSSLSYLEGYPFDRLKIDKSFIMNLSDENSSVVRTIIQLARNLNLKVTAEGVESESHVEFLQNEKCDELQGFYFSRPIPRDAFEYEWLFKT